ncbi:MAG TPA: hypothetical protein VLS51_07260, partial [Propionibacteriaceae bacterium]|nr:hypothetical protein [Propionibacteriaceae bacterium]
LLVVSREWSGDTVELTLGTRLEAVPLVDQPDSVAFVDGGVVLAGICDEERRLVGDVTDPRTILQPAEEQGHSWWSAHTWRTAGQDRGMRFMALSEVTDETYTVYFPVEQRR